MVQQSMFLSVHSTLAVLRKPTRISNQGMHHNTKAYRKTKVCIQIVSKCCVFLQSNPEFSKCRQVFHQSSLAVPAPPMHALATRPSFLITSPRSNRNELHHSPFLSYAHRLLLFVYMKNGCTEWHFCMDFAYSEGHQVVVLLFILLTSHYKTWHLESCVPRSFTRSD